MCNEQLQIRLRGAASLVRQARFEVSGDALGFGDDKSGMVRGHDFFCSFGKEGEPAAEVAGLKRKLEMSHHRVALVTSRGEHDGGPEIFEQSQVRRPVFDCLVEYGADLGIELNPGIKAIDQV